MTKIFTFASPIAGGKSTLMNHLSKLDSNIVIVDDSLDLIRNIDGENFLEMYYKDVCRWGFTSQLLFFITRINNVINTINMYGHDSNRIYILEGDWFSSKTCFGEMLRDDGCITEAEHNIYNEFYDFVSKYTPSISGYIFLECSMLTYLTRLNNRGRVEESNVGVAFEQRLVQQHDALKKICVKSNIPYLCLNNDVSMIDIEPYNDNLIRVLKFIKDN